METISKKEAIEAVKKLFFFERNKESRNVVVTEKDGDATFMISKQYLERYEVINRLQEFFADKTVDGGQCRVEGMTFVYTVVHIEDR